MSNDLAHYGLVGRFYKNSDVYKWVDSLFGYRQAQNTQQSLSAQMDYERYLAAANARALSDWYDNVGRYGRTIRYPELSYAGQIRRANTSFNRASFDYDTSVANYYGNLPYRVAGLYGVASTVSRYM